MQDAGLGLFDPDQPATAKPHYLEHRTRLRDRFAAAGPEALADYELLELILFRIIPRRDTKPLAKALLARFGDFGSVIGAAPDLIAEVDGAGPAVALELKVVQAAVERALRAEGKRAPVLGSWSKLVDYCRAALMHAREEQFRVLFLNVKNELIADEVLGTGTIDQAPVYPREVVRRALGHGAAALVLVHNHPSGDPTPSSADQSVTRDVVAAASALSIKVHDHIIVGRNGVASLRALGMM